MHVPSDEVGPYLCLGCVPGQFVAQLLQLGLQVLDVLPHLDVLALKLLEFLVCFVQLCLDASLDFALLLVPTGLGFSSSTLNTSCQLGRVAAYKCLGLHIHAKKTHSHKLCALELAISAERALHAMICRSSSLPTESPTLQCNGTGTESVDVTYT